MNTWSIKRHGGNSNHCWRTIYTGSEDQCRDQFEKESAKLRQGGLVLLDRQGRTIESVIGKSECKWIEDDDGVWETECGQAFDFNDGGPNDNKFRFCPYCGKPLHSSRRGR